MTATRVPLVLHLRSSRLNSHKSGVALSQRVFLRENYPPGNGSTLGDRPVSCVYRTVLREGEPSRFFYP